MHVPASRAGVYVNLEPVTSALLGITILKDAFSAATILGGLMILLASVVITTSSGNSAQEQINEMCCPT